MVPPHAVDLIKPPHFAAADPDPYDDETNCPVIISLMQRQKQRKCEHFIGFKIYQCDLGVRSIDEMYMKRHNLASLSDKIRGDSRGKKMCCKPCLVAKLNNVILNLIKYIEKA